jgi:hypothetical protein
MSIAGKEELSFLEKEAHSKHLSFHRSFSFVPSTSLLGAALDERWCEEMNELKGRG